MFRGESVVNGVSTTGTGTLTLAATPTPPGGADLDVWARAFGFGNSAAILLLYHLIEYTDNTFATAKQEEIGMGTLTLGASTGIANCTLSRDTILHTITSMNSQPASYALSGSKITIGAAANCLVMLAPSTMDSGFNDFVLCDQLGDACPGASDFFDSGYATGGYSPNLGFQMFWPFVWTGARPVTKASLYCSTGVASAVLEAAIYQMTDHNTLKRVVDLTNGRANLFNGATSGLKQNTSAGGAFTSFYLPPGMYVKGLIQTGGGATWAGPNRMSSAVRMFGTSSGNAIGQIYRSGQTALPASYTIAGSGVNTWDGNSLSLFLGW